MKLNDDVGYLYIVIRRARGATRFGETTPSKQGSASLNGRLSFEIIKTLHLEICLTRPGAGGTSSLKKDAISFRFQEPGYANNIDILLDYAYS